MTVQPAADVTKELKRERFYYADGKIVTDDESVLRDKKRI